MCRNAATFIFYVVDFSYWGPGDLNLLFNLLHVVTSSYNNNKNT